MSRVPLLVLLLVLLPAGSVLAAELHFEHLTINDGLPENSVRAILQDRQGFLWFGTQNGVARYDGTDMQVHLPDPDNPASIGVRFVLTMAEDQAGNIWMGSYSGGLSVYDPATEQFTNFGTEADSLPGPGIAALAQSGQSVWATTAQGRLHRVENGEFHLVDIPVFAPAKTGGLTGLDVTPRELWVGSTRAGIAWKDRINGSWQHLRSQPGDSLGLPSDFITFIERDRQGRIWVGSRAGLALHRGNGKFMVFKPRPEEGESEANYLVCLTEGPEGDFWIGSAAGLYQFAPEEGRFTLHPHDPDRPNSPVLGPVLSVLSDRSGIVWAGSWHTGLNKYDPSSSKFRVYLHDPADPGSLDGNSIGSVFEDQAGTLWVATGSRSTGGSRGGLNYRRRGQTAFQHLALPLTEAGDQVRTVHAMGENPPGRLWLGTDKGLWQLEAATGQVRRPPAMDRAPEQLPNGMISDLAIDQAGRVWLANWLGGIARFDPLTDGWTQYSADPEVDGGLQSNDMTSVTMDDQGRIWAGSDSGGLYLFDPETDQFRILNHLDGHLEAILHITPAGQGRVLLGSGSGVHLCDAEEVIRSYTTRNGMITDFVGLLVQDARKNIWASTGLGLARIDSRTDEIRMYDERDGLPRNELYFAECMTRSGEIYLGGQHGMIAFHPDSLKTSSFIPPVRITRITVQDEPLNVGPDSPLEQSLAHTQVIRLGPRQNDISLSFAALDYSHPERNRYRFRLNPLDEDWRQGSSGNTAHYTNLGPGHYNFEVQGSNSDGIWNETPTTLRITIFPPWYRTTWAMAAYVLLAIGLTFGVFRSLINRERIRLALEMERTEARQLQKLDHLKSQFFTNISHEFRTPLTLLTAPLQRLQADPRSGNAELFETMGRNARRLARLIDQLLDLSRLEADRLPSHWRRGDWGQYLKALASSFGTLAEQRKIVFTTHWPEEAPEAWFDPDILDKVLVNLLSNALKFTPTGGEVTLTVSVTPEARLHPWPGSGEKDVAPGKAFLLAIRVLNTGSHIPPDELDQVFDRFHQITQNSDFGDLGSGIGLALVKELTEWCHGQARVESGAASGTTFTITLPLYLDAPPGSPLSSPIPEPSMATELGDEGDEPGFEEDLEEIPDPDKPAILLVEDNADLRTYVRQELQEEFHVMLAANGQAGLEAARSEIPDLVLSDVMMPGMDGNEMCRLLKEDDLTSHIPLIMLTAKADAESRKEGLQVGADDYVAKPFDVEELRIRIRNLIQQRQLLAQRYAQLEGSRPGHVVNPVSTVDDRFLSKAREIILENLDDPDFRVDRLCREVGMSRTQLHRKFKAVAGRSAGEFIRIERLNKAAEMLGNREGNVTEVAYSVGYRSLSQFAKAFREQFGMPPSDFEA